MIWYLALGFPFAGLVFFLTSMFQRDNVVPGFLSSVFFFASAFSVVNVDFVGDFSAAGLEKYTYLGDDFLAGFFVGLGVFMLVYVALIVLSRLNYLSLGEAYGLAK